MLQQETIDFQHINSLINSSDFSKIVILTDTNTHELCLPMLQASLATHIPIEIIEIEPGEEMKTAETAVQLWEILSEVHIDRHALMINLGGGVICDLGGFVAATYKRGIGFINVPTTLLAMCDAAIGGKTGIDLNHLKNIVGTFTKPLQTYIYPKFLATLPENQLKSGLAEMLKHGLVFDAAHWQKLISLTNISAESLHPYIYESAAIKQRIVNEDFYEHSTRKTLNFGHTAGHAIESLFLEHQKPILHGEAVAAGMIIEAYLASSTGEINENELSEITSGIEKHFQPLDISQFSNEMLLQKMRSDKKNRADNIRFSLLSGIGKGNFDKNCAENLIHGAINDYRNMRI